MAATVTAGVTRTRAVPALLWAVTRVAVWTGIRATGTSVQVRYTCHCSDRHNSDTYFCTVILYVSLY